MLLVYNNGNLLEHLFNFLVSGINRQFQFTFHFFNLLVYNQFVKVREVLQSLGAVRRSLSWSCHPCLLLLLILVGGGYFHCVCVCVCVCSGTRFCLWYVYVHVHCTCVYVHCTCVYVHCTTVYVHCTCVYVQCTCVYVQCTTVYVQCTTVYVYRFSCIWLTELVMTKLQPKGGTVYTTATTVGPG